MATPKEEKKKVSLPKSFLFGGISGCIGATTVYPIDMIKTRLQNQRNRADGTRVYNGAVDCARKLLANEGVLGFYKGWPAQMVGIMPEKAIKLGVLDIVRRSFGKMNGRPDDLYLPLWQEGAAGGIAGLCHVVATNPYEIVKIQMQTQGTLAPEKRKSMVQVLQALGLRGMFQGSSACFVRDVGFNTMYFALYAHFKQKATPEDGQLTFLRSLAAGTLAGVFGSAFWTPADVMKTRLQAAPPEGEAPYKGLLDCFARVYRTEGVSALYKGAGPRVLIISPLFGVTMYCYETFTRMFA